MKKTLAIFLAILFCLLFSACGKKEEFNGSPDDIPIMEVQSEPQEKFYSANELKSFITTVDLTTDNY